jgi:cellobiose phosphorylase
LTGLAYFHADGRVDRLLHPSDRTTGISYSLLPMIHAILYDLLTPEEASIHREIIRRELLAPDGARLFDAPTRYRGGEQVHFQRAETAAFFGREIGVMYTHAHLRYAEAMARLGDADALFLALRQLNPIALRSVVPSSALRQANCYYSSSDAAFADRYEASERYDEVKRGTIAFEGGWRIYSSGAGIAVRLIHERFLGIERRRSCVVFDPVVPVALDGLEAEAPICDTRATVRYRTGRKGSGPVSITVNGRLLPFDRLANRYRSGGAKVELGTIRAELGAGANVIEIRLE